jgi:hypothetical protein
MPLGVTFPHARYLAATRRSLGQCNRVCDLVILRFLLQNQQWSVDRLRMRLKYTADRQWPHRICATVLARQFLVLSRHDFFGGGRGTYGCCPGASWGVTPVGFGLGVHLRNPCLQVREGRDGAGSDFRAFFSREGVSGFVARGSRVSFLLKVQ